MSKPPRPPDKKTQLLLASAAKRFRSHFSAGRYAEALAQSLYAIQLMPALPMPAADAAVCCIKLERWEEAIRYASRAVQQGSTLFSPYDALAHAWGALNNREEARRWGNMALAMRDRQFSRPASAHIAVPLPPAPSPSTRDKNLIAFSLFGGQAKYCECAVLNAIERERIYPHWTSRFYVDDSVPSAVLARLTRPGCEVVHVPPEVAQWPGPMWRFLAYDTPGVHRVLFRDADSVINEREAEAVAEWIGSGRSVHLMRDACTHTELILAGLWGVIGGALPAMQPLVGQFLSRPVDSEHFADQHFLREYLWPHTRNNALIHDSVFGFLDAKPFPGGPSPEGWHVGYPEGAPIFEVASELPEGSAVTWTLYRHADGGEQPICAYPGRVRKGVVVDHLPRRYTKALQAGELFIRIRAAE